MRSPHASCSRGGISLSDALMASSVAITLRVGYPRLAVASVSPAGEASALHIAWLWPLALPAYRRLEVNTPRSRDGWAARRQRLRRCRRTSSRAPEIRPLSWARTRSDSLTRPPRAVFTINGLRFIASNSGMASMLRVSSVSGECSVVTSLVSSTCSHSNRTAEGALRRGIGPDQQAAHGPSSTSGPYERNPRYRSTNCWTDSAKPSTSTSVSGSDSTMKPRAAM